MLSDSSLLLIVLLVALLLGAMVAFYLHSLAQLRRGLGEMSAGLASRLEAGSSQLHARLDGVTSQVSQRLDVVTGQVNERLRETTSSLDQRLAENTASLNERLAETLRLAQEANRTVGERLEGVGRVVGDVQAGLGQMGEASRRILEVGQSIASLQEILQAPKLRGGLGELFLAEVLAQILTPEHFSLHHRFRSGETVDAVLRLGGGLVPIDSKFPLEAFRRMMQLEEPERQRERRQFGRDVKRHIEAIGKKYILPDEGTFDFAFMYVPAENVYYEVILRDEELGEGGSLLEHALTRRVIPVSPASFYAYLQSILLGLRGLRIEQQAREIYGHLRRLQGDFERFGECFDTLGKHLKNAQNTYERADGMRKKFEVKLETSAQLGAGTPEEMRAVEEAAEATAEIPLFPEEPEILDGPVDRPGPAEAAEADGTSIDRPGPIGPPASGRGTARPDGGGKVDRKGLLPERIG
jgi:DNA recombination protein RmuC